MGTIYLVACKDCKVVRDLDKFYGARSVENRDDALEHRKEIVEHEGWSFRAALLVSFMAEHIGHECVFFNEHSECEMELDPYYKDSEYKNDVDFWREGK